VIVPGQIGDMPKAEFEVDAKLVEHALRWRLQ